MSKKLVVRFFVWSLLGLGASIAMIVAAVVIALLSDAFVLRGDEVVGVNRNAAVIVAVAMAAVGVLVMIAAGVGQFVAWIGAVVNTYDLADKTWFVILLIAGLLSVGFVATLVYVLIGPDGTQQQVPPVRSGIGPEDDAERRQPVG
jgi:MFS family permease